MMSELDSIVLEYDVNGFPTTVGDLKRDNAALVKENQELNSEFSEEKEENTSLSYELEVLKKRWEELGVFVKEYLGGYERHVNNFAEEIIETMKELQAGSK